MAVGYKAVRLPHGGLAWEPRDETLRGWRLVRKVIGTGKFAAYEIQFNGAQPDGVRTILGLKESKRELERLATARAVKEKADG